jgi:Carboxypeptidase regulatory-like domain
MRSFFSLRAAGVVAAAAVLSVSGLHAQTVTGSVSGTVFDPSDAVVPNATVAVVNVATGVRTTATSNSAGVYSIRFLPIGQYRVEVTALGFSTLTVPSFTLEVDQTAKVDAHITVGGAGTTVQVQGEVAPILNTTDGTVSLAFSSKEISTIPLNGRNFSSVTLFQPGAVDTDPQGLVGPNALERTTFNNGIVAQNGNRAQANNYSLDGVDLNEGQNNLIGYNPAPDAIQEIRVISADAPATYGNVNGGDVVTVLKSGTNQFHGSAYGYLENQNLNANSFSNKYSQPIQPINPFTQSQFGGTIGGPIKRDKLFFFVDYEGIRQHSGGTGTASVFTAAQRQGDFSALLNASTPRQLYDTQNNFAPYVNDQVPILNPVATYLFAHPEIYPLPNATPQDGLVQNNYIGFTRTARFNNQGDVKIDWNPRTQDKITGFYAQSTAQDGTIAVLPVAFPSINVFPTKVFGATWVHTFSPSIVNEARIGFLRVRWDQNVPTDPTGLFGLRGNSIVGIPFGQQVYPGFSFQSIGDNFSGFGTPGAAAILRDNTFYYGDNLTWQKGKHLISLGVQAVRYQQNYALTGAQGSLGQFSFNGIFTGNGNGTNGYSGADFVLDRASGDNVALTGSGLVGNRQWRTAEFVQDTWKATDRLSLTFGVRYEYDQRWNEVNNKTANVLLTGPLAGTVEYAGSVPVGAPAGSIVCDNPSCYQPTFDQIQPRLGFAYQAAPRWVVRGGYGATSFFEGDANNQRLTFQTPFLAAATVTATTPSVAAGTSPYNPGSPIAVTNGFSVNSINNQGAGFGAWPQNIQPAYVHEFNLTTEYELTNTLSLSAAYVGETGQHLADYRNGNQLTLAQATDIASLPSGAPIPAADTAPFANLVGQGGNLLITESEAGFNFNAGEITVRQRGSKGFAWTVNYTYAKALTNSAGNYTSANITGQDGAYQDGYNGRADYGPEGQDIRHNLSAVGVYSLPFGRGQSHGGTLNRPLDLLLGGWSVSSSVIAYSGFPITINGPQNSNTNSFGSARANHYRPLKIVNRSIAHWFGTDPSAVPCNGPDNGVCAYGTSSPNSFGTAAVGSERVPGYSQIDASGFKDFHITERQAVGFRADAFNVFNTASYGNPDSNVTDSNFGQINNTRSLSRIIQLSAHYTF